PGGRIVGMVDGVDLIELAFRIVLDDDLQRTQDSHPPQGRSVENLAYGKIEHCDVDHAVGLGNPDPLDEIAYRLRRDTPPAQPCKRRHARVVPARDVPAPHQFSEYALGQHRMGEIEPRELVLARPGWNRKVFDKPVVEGSMILEFERAQRVRDVLDRIRLAMGKIVTWINAPRRAGARMARMQNAIEHRIAQIDVARGHVDLGAQDPRTIRKFARPHASEKVEALFDRAFAPRAIASGLS